MKKLKKELLAVALCLAVVAGCVAAGTLARAREARVPLRPLETNFYIGQLTPQEKEIYEALARQLLEFKPRVLELKSPITLRSANRISQSLDMNDDRFFHYAMFLPIDKSGRALPLDDEAAEIWAIAPLTSSMLYLDRDGENFNYYILYDFDDSWQEHVGIGHINRLLEAGLTPQDAARYRAMRQSLDERLDAVIAGLPKDATRREAVVYFCDWIAQNIAYDYPSYYYLHDSQRVFSATAWEATLYSNRTNSILAGSAKCGGICQMMRTFLNRVGIPSYIVQGTVGGDHAWIKADLGEGYVVFDPTFYRSGYRHVPMSEAQLLEKYGNQKTAAYFNF